MRKTDPLALEDLELWKGKYSALTSLMTDAIGEDQSEKRNTGYIMADLLKELEKCVARLKDRAIERDGEKPYPGKPGEVFLEKNLYRFIAKVELAAKGLSILSGELTGITGEENSKLRVAGCDIGEQNRILYATIKEIRKALNEQEDLVKNHE